MSSRLAVTRRAVLAALGATPLAACMVTGNPPLPIARIRTLRVDVGPLAERGLPNWAGRIRTIAETAVRDAFADALAPNDRAAADVTLVIDQAWLASYSGSIDVFDDHTTLDWMDGWLTTSAAHGLPALRRRVYAQASPADSGPWYVPEIDARRIERLTRVWVASARRELSDS